jgi:hypothetical protein
VDGEAKIVTEPGVQAGPIGIQVKGLARPALTRQRDLALGQIKPGSQQLDFGGALGVDDFILIIEQGKFPIIRQAAAGGKGRPIGLDPIQGFDRENPNLVQGSHGLLQNGAIGNSYYSPAAKSDLPLS